MKTDVITVSGAFSGTEAALRQAEKVAGYKGLTPKSALQLRLLTEEMMGLMRGITGEKDGQFWIEDNDGVYELHLRVITVMDPEKRGRLLSVSGSGKNEAAKGLMGRLRDFFDRSADEGPLPSTSPLMFSESYDYSSTPMLDWDWSMTEYRDRLRAKMNEQDENAREMWDELEQSVVTHVADDVKVSIRGAAAELIIVKKLG
ncbi:MAG: hypothetical protein IKH18_05090 [Clostridia bacterium]|nr:hypothetical protein [Clostridia bacterium]